MDLLGSAMDRLGPFRSDVLMTHTNTTDHTANTMPAHRLLQPNLRDIDEAIRKRSYCSLATVSPAGFPHVAGVIYALADGDLWIGTQRHSRKARNIASNERVHVSIPVRRSPVGPPSAIQFAASAVLVDADDEAFRGHVRNGRLRSITSHGELELADVCFVRISPSSTIHTYGLGLSLRALIKDPLHAAGRIDRS
jgi:nitroimidazol reductase NimA-like FMN-containing flavoprotein (pyridoxamine 5'-phosphate oxidase superfamily)